MLAITEKDDHTVLLFCFRSGCSVADIVGAVGLDLSDLFPPRESVHASKPVKRGRRFTALQVIGAINLELLEVLVIVGSILRRGSVTPAEHERLCLAISRVAVAEGACHD
ncbi:hypothetical protein [Paraburkholderia sp. BR13444]|uniref:hypothetical protein n=1 Tax=Paraburkholderia sp. BR13444 TaxID=3236997 RepID=UPI0034CFC5CB